MRAIAIMGWTVLFAASWAGGALSSTAQESEHLFEAKIRPVLAVKCFRCHGNGKESGGLRVDSREALLKGGESGPALVPSKPGDSLLIRAIERHADVSAMPPENEKALRAEEVADFVAWVEAGAHWPENTAKFSALTHWAFEPVRNLATPIRRTPLGLLVMAGRSRCKGRNHAWRIRRVRYRRREGSRPRA